jgi:hypothetical protein
MESNGITKGNTVVVTSLIGCPEMQVMEILTDGNAICMYVVQGVLYQFQAKTELLEKVGPKKPRQISSSAL